MANKISDTFTSMGCWYEVEPARTGRSRCKEFRCKQQIEEYELRIGIMAEETDHSGNNFGWYHPACLWKTFSYKTNANPRIARGRDIQGYNSLCEEHKEIIDDLVKNGVSSVASPVKKQAGGEKFKLTLSHVASKKADGESYFVVSGNTFNCKEQLKSFGARWNFEGKNWDFTHEKAEKLLKALDIDTLPDLGKSVPVVLTSGAEKEADGDGGEAALPAKKEPAVKPSTAKKTKKNTGDSEVQKKKSARKKKDESEEEEEDDYDD